MEKEISNRPTKQEKEEASQIIIKTLLHQNIPIEEISYLSNKPIDEIIKMKNKISNQEKKKNN